MILNLALARSIFIFIFNSSEASSRSFFCFMLDASAIESTSLIFSLIACTFMEVLEPELHEPLDTDDFYFSSCSTIFLNDFLHYLGCNYGRGVNI